MPVSYLMVPFAPSGNMPEISLMTSHRFSADERKEGRKEGKKNLKDLSQWLVARNMLRCVHMVMQVTALTALASIAATLQKMVQL